MVDTASLIERRRQILLNTPHFETISDTMASFKTDVPAPVKDCKVYFTPVQEGEGDPSPDNIRPITGWDGVEVYKTGKNLCPNVLESTTLKGVTATVNNDGSITVNGTATGYGELYISKEELILPELINYSFKGAADGGANSTYRLYFEFYNYKTNAWNGKALITSSRIETFTSDIIRRVMIQFYSGTVFDNVTFYPMVCKSTETDLTYEPFGSILTIPFPQTIYGGYVDLVKGEVVEEWDYGNMDRFEWKYDSSVKRFESPYLDGALRTAGQVTCLSDIYNGISNVTGGYFNANAPDKSMCFNTISGRPYLILKDSNYTDATSFKASLSGHELGYKRVSPITHQLTQETIKTLRGINNIWSNANGNIEVKFWKH